MIMNPGELSKNWYNPLQKPVCDSCSSLYCQGLYCPICLQVYEEDDDQPMICCESCNHWVHCLCDNISKEQYIEFSNNEDLEYTCPKCLNIDDEILALTNRLKISRNDRQFQNYQNYAFTDIRKCSICHLIGDRNLQSFDKLRRDNAQFVENYECEGRLLPVDHNSFVHISCALFSGGN